VRILYHHRTLADGAEGIHIASMVEAFTSLGHEVRMIGVAPTATVQRQRTVVHQVRSVLPNAAFEAASLALNIPEYIQIRRELARFKPDLLYKRHARYDVAALLAAPRHGVPSALEVNTVFTANEYERYEPLAMRGVARVVERRSFELATVVFAVSTPLAHQVSAASSARAIVLPNGADPALFDPASAHPERIRTLHRLAPGALVIGWTGILREWHGLELLLEAVARIRGVTLLLVGDGPARPLVEARAAQAGVGDRVVITGRVPHTDVRDYIAAMDIAVVADERTGVASPMKLLEYMAMSRAVVAPAMDNLRDLIVDGSDGLLFRPGDCDALAARLEELAMNAARRAELGRAARAKVNAERNWRQIAATVLAGVSTRATEQTRQQARDDPD